MQHRGYDIFAEVETFEHWTIDENGRPVEHVQDLDSIEVTGYSFESINDSFFQAGSQMPLDMLRDIIDDHITELGA